MGDLEYPKCPYGMERKDMAPMGDTCYSEMKVYPYV